MRARVVEVVVLVIAAALIGLAMRPRPEPAPPPVAANAHVPSAGPDDAMALMAVMGVVQIVRASLPTVESTTCLAAAGSLSASDIRVNGVGLGMSREDVHAVLGNDYAVSWMRYTPHQRREIWTRECGRPGVTVFFDRSGRCAAVTGDEIKIRSEVVTTADGARTLLGEPDREIGANQYYYAGDAEIAVGWTPQKELWVALSRR